MRAVNRAVFLAFLRLLRQRARRPATHRLAARTAGMIAALFVIAGFAIAVGGATYEAAQPVMFDGEQNALDWTGWGALVAAPGMLIALTVAGGIRGWRWPLIGTVVIVLYWLTGPALHVLAERFEWGHAPPVLSVYSRSIGWAFTAASKVSPPYYQYVSAVMLGSYVSTALWWALVAYLRRRPTPA